SNNTTNKNKSSMSSPAVMNSDLVAARGDGRADEAAFAAGRHGGETEAGGAEKHNSYASMKSASTESMATTVEEENNGTNSHNFAGSPLSCIEKREELLEAIAKERRRSRGMDRLKPASWAKFVLAQLLWLFSKIKKPKLSTASLLSKLRKSKKTGDQNFYRNHDKQLKPSTTSTSPGALTNLYYYWLMPPIFLPGDSSRIPPQPDAITYTLRGLCRRSLCIFAEHSTTRRLCVSIIKNVWFERFILTLILVNAIMQAFIDYRNPNGFATTFVENTEHIFTLCFFLEMVVKVIALGFILDKTSYLRDAWSWLDFLVVVSGLVSFF
ncbi:unnamed protein product, partial [Amoebophrya sp. A120]